MKANRIRRLTAALLLAGVLLACTLFADADEAYAATPTQDKTEVYGTEFISLPALKLGGANYVKLRDFAALLSGTPGQFSVEWSKEKQAITLFTGHPYQPTGTEFTALPDKKVLVKKANPAVYVNSWQIPADRLQGYNLDDNNYFKLRDLCQALGIDVGWNAENRAIIIGSPDAAPLERYEPIVVEPGKGEKPTIDLNDLLNNPASIAMDTEKGS